MANATITARTTGTTTQENNDAVVTFDLSSALASATTVKVGVTPQGGATTADYSGFQYHMGTGVGGWVNVPNDGVITINAGFTDFQLKVNVTNDNFTEGYDAINFTVAQTANSVGLEDSWWVPSLVNLLDAQGTGAAALPRTITAGATTTGVEASATPATATFNVSGGGTADYANTEVRVSMYGLGGATPADYTGSFQYNVGTGWTNVPGNGLITIPSAATTFQLAISAASDGLTETGEGISFNVAQTTSSIGLVDSWWVPNIVNLQDAQGTGAVAFPRTITAAAPTTGMEGAVDWTVTGTPAMATFNVSGGGTADYANTTIRVSMYGTGGAIPADYSGFKYHMGTAPGGWTDVPVGGLIPIGRNDTVFQLASYAVTDAIAETGEGISFTVAQTTSSIGLVDSWWVQSTADLADVAAVYTIRTGSIGPDHFTATAATEMFVIPAGTSLAAANGATGVLGGDIYFTSGESFDTITGFTSGTDKIDLPPVATNTAFTFSGTATGSAATEVALLTALQGYSANLGATEIGRFTVTANTNAYFLVNTSGNATWDAADDILIKIVGGSTVVVTDFV